MVMQIRFEDRIIPDLDTMRFNKETFINHFFNGGACKYTGH